MYAGATDSVQDLDESPCEAQETLDRLPITIRGSFVELNARFWSTNTAAWIDAIAAATGREASGQYLENLAFRDTLITDTIVLKDFALLCAIPLRNGCDLMDVIGRRLQK